MFSFIRSKLDAAEAISIIKETHEALLDVAGPHWNALDGDDIPDASDCPRMVRELARDRDDYRRMAEAYRAELTRLERDMHCLDERCCAHSVEHVRMDFVIGDELIADDLDEEDS